MTDKINHEWKYYIDIKYADQVYLEDYPSLVTELRDQYYMYNPPDWYVREYWDTKVTLEWRRGGDMDFLWKQTGRPHVKGLQPWAMRAQCNIHLNDCLNKSYAFCDLKASHETPGYIACPHNSVICSECVPQCKQCHSQIHASESLLYCARCYRQVLNQWRPI
jgi:hypothetical protein